MRVYIRKHPRHTWLLFVVLLAPIVSTLVSNAVSRPPDRWSVVAYADAVLLAYLFFVVLRFERTARAEAVQTDK